MIVKNLIVTPSAGEGTEDPVDSTHLAFSQALGAAHPVIGMEFGTAELNHAVLSLYLDTKYQAVKDSYTNIEVDWRTPSIHEVDPVRPWIWIPTESSLRYTATITDTDTGATTIQSFSISYES